MLIFTLATLTPLPLLLAATLWGGVWGALALGYMTVFAFLLDEVIEYADDGTETAEGVEFPAADRLSVVLALAHFALIPVVLAGLTGMTGLGTGARIALLLAAGLFMGQVSNSNAHELIHRGNRRLFRLGVWVYVSMLFGHHASAHRHIHHRHVASDLDPNTAAAGEGFWEFLPRAWIGSFTAGHEIETALRQRAGGRRGLHPYVTYLVGAALFGIAVAVVFGAGGVLAYLLLAGYAQMQLLLSDYVQHYGLRREVLAGGQLAPVAEVHSWNAPHWFTSALMLNAPRHSAHHAHPSRPYPALGLPEPGQAPELPFSLPAMAAIALIPPLWRRVMDRRLARWLAAQPARTGA